MRKGTVLIAILALTASVSACGSNSDSSSSEVAVTANSNGDFNDADVLFAQEMTLHHEQAVEMAQMALSSSAYASPQVKDLAQRIENAQGPEIAMMKGWLTDWNMPMEMSGMSHASGMMSNDEMASLKSMTYAEFDKMWLELMIKHHQGAVEVANGMKSSGKSGAVLMLANQIISGQTAEIAEMQLLLK